MPSPAGETGLVDAGLLTLDSAVPFLVRTGVISEADVADGTVVVDAVARRNNNLRVRMDDGTGYFIKQASELSRSSRSLSREGRFYAECARRRPTLSSVLPGFVLFDPVTAVLVLRLLPHHQGLGVHCATTPRSGFPIHLWRTLGATVAAVHGCVPGEPSMATPMAQMIDPSPDALGTLGPGGLTVFEIAQTRTLRRGLERVADLWRPEVFVHGDLRAENILIATTASSSSDSRLVDWELCGLGDPMWDVAALLDLAITLSVGRFVAGELSIPLVQATSRSAWDAYRSARATNGMSGTAATTTVAEYTASRLVQSALELSEQVGELSSQAVFCLQVAENIFEDPAGAALDLLALTA